MIAPAELAKQFAGHRPGFELVHYEEVGLPYFRLVLDAVIQQRKPIGPIEEFVLRGVDSGLDSIDDIVGLLGVERVLVEQAVVALNQVDHLDYRLENEARVLRMTPLGERALGGWKDMEPAREEVLIGFDRLTWSPTGRHFRSLMRLQDAKASDLRVLPPYRKKRLRPSDVDIDLAQAAIRDISHRSLQNAELIAIKDVRNHQMVLPAIALVYASEDGSDQQVALAIDGRLSEAHETAFAEIDGPSRAGLLVDGTIPEDERLHFRTPVGLEFGDKAVVRELKERIASATAAKHRAQTETATAEASAADLSVADLSEQRSSELLRGAQEELASLPVRAIQTYEHRVLLEDALASATRRLLIISPWIRSDVIDYQFLRSLRARLDSGVEVHVGWGISDGEDEKEQAPLKKLRELARGSSAFTLRRLGNTHAKVLIWDDNLVVTSFNWLSFRGDRKRGFRQEEGVLITAPQLVDPEYSKYHSLISSAPE